MPRPTSRVRLVALAALAVLAAGFVGLSGPAIAQNATSAAPATSSAGSSAATGTVKPAPLATGLMQVQVAPEAVPSQAVVIVAVEVTKTVDLPAMVRIPVPKGAEITWTGEIGGQDLSQDIERPYRLTQGTGGQVLEMTLEQTRTAQAEFVLSNLVQKGDAYSMVLDWVQSAPAEETQFSVMLPAGVSKVAIVPEPVGPPQFNAVQESLYTLPSSTLKAGATEKVSVSYSKAVAAPSGSSGSSGNTLIWWLLGAFVLVIALLGLAVMAQRRRSAGDDSAEQDVAQE